MRMTFGNSYWQRREPLVPREQMWANEEAKSIEERRRRYRCRGNYVTLEEIAPWVVYREGIAERQKQEKEAHRRWLAQRKEAYRRRKLQHEARKQRIKEKKQRKAEREEKRREARQAKAEAKALLQQQQQAQKEQEELKQQEEKQVEQDVPTEATAAAGVEAGDVTVNVEGEEVKREEKQEDGATSDSDSDDEKDRDDDEEDDLSTSSEWSELSTSEEEPSEEEEEEVEEKAPSIPTAYHAPDEELNRIVTMWRGDITQLEIDAIVNAANRSLLGGGGIDGAIHRAAGDDLYNECRQLNGCVTGHCKISRGYALPAKYVIHTVGPIGEHPVALRSCYLNCLRVAVQNGVRSLAFCGISTGIYGYPLYEASHIALRTVRRWLEEGDNRTKFDSIIFCVFLDKERICYERLLPLYFPSTGAPYEVLPLQPGEDLEVPPMVEQESSSSSSEGDSDDDDEEEEGIPDAPPPPPANAENEVVTAQLAAGVEALAISAPETAQGGAEAPAAPAPEATANANDTTAASADPAAAVANP